MKRFVLIAAVAALSLSLAGCKNLLGTIGIGVASSAADTAATVAGPIPNQVSDLADALRVSTLANKATTLIVQTGKLTADQLNHINAANDAVHAALGKLETDNAANKALSFSAFNAALVAYNTYTAELPAK